MTDEDALTLAARSCPTARLAYADFLDEQSRPLDAALQRVLAEPECDRHRLDYATACEGVGDAARAEFIRVQVELSANSLFDPAFRHRSLELRGLERRLLKAVPKRHDSYWLNINVELWAPRPFGDDWVQKFGWQPPRAMAYQDGGYIGYQIDGATISSSKSDGPYSMTFRRGFVESVSCTAADWLKDGDALCEVTPVREVKLTTFPRISDRWMYYGGTVYSKIGGKKLHVDWSKYHMHREKGLLAHDWPGVTFHFPA